jgi:hypothetical protein
MSWLERLRQLHDEIEAEWARGGDLEHDEHHQRLCDERDHLLIGHRVFILRLIEAAQAKLRERPIDRMLRDVPDADEGLRDALRPFVAPQDGKESTHAEG